MPGEAGDRQLTDMAADDRASDIRTIAIIDRSRHCMNLAPV